MQIPTIVRWLLQKPGTTELAPLWKLLPQVGGHEQRLRGLADSELTAAARAARDDAEICACGREAARRTLGERPYDVQVLGTLAMMSGLVAEMATGEGKTLSGALAAAGYALRGRSVHVMSVNDYLARRDAEWMLPVYALQGVTVGWIGQASTAAERRRAYAAQVTYAPVSEFGFDVLRDRLVTDTADLIAGDPDVVLIDEADSVLIDEARVPLVLAGAAEAADADREMARIAAGLHPGQHYEIDEDGRNVSLTSAGASTAEQALGGIDLYTAEHADELTRLNVALHAHALLQRDVDYIVVDGAVHLINESRGRVAQRQRWPDGLHAAVEAKEDLAASESGEILDTITIQSLVRRYRTICGMTGTAVAAGEQFREFYGLEIAVIPPNRPCVRADEPDRLFPTVKEKEKAVISQVAETHATGRPVLIGTLDVAESERLASELGHAGLRCTVLNAKNDAREAAIVAEAGALGAITVSTQMAGRGTDIRLGGTSGDRTLTAGLGGLYVIGTGRHASSRLDHQLRGRAGRQGDPGGSVFFASMDDELILQYAPDEPRAEVPAPKAHWTLGHAQRVAEGVNLEIHRNTWQYNKLVEDQRQIVLHHRERVLRTDDALSALARQCPERLAELSPGIDRTVLAGAARQIVLFHLDRAWVEHLAFLADLREGIHLRALARGTVPLNEFNREAIGGFRTLLEEAAARSAETFLTAEITPGGIDLEAMGLKRPTSTWTYLVHENPFGTDIDRALRSTARRIRKLFVLCRTEACFEWTAHPYVSAQLVLGVTMALLANNGRQSPTGEVGPAPWRGRRHRTTMIGMTFLGLLILYTIFVLSARHAATKIWRFVHEQGMGALVIRVPRLRDVGWGAALAPVTTSFLVLSGTFGITNVGGTGSGNLFGAKSIPGDLFYTVLVLAVVAFYTVVQPRRAGYLAAAGLTGIGAWVLYQALVLPHSTYDSEWYGWLRDQLYFPELLLLGMAGLAGGFFLTRHTIVADVRASRNGLAAQVERLSRTRAEAVNSAAAELRRLERDLHDGAQARLVALGVNLRTAEKLIDTSPGDAKALVADCREASAKALSELRGLVRGIYPPVLADRGLADAIKALALDCPISVLTDIQLPGRPPTPIESAVYFAVAEVLSNAAKHAEATAIHIRVTHARGMLRVQVDDDGVGGADPGSGTGLAGMERRLGAFDGILAVSSPVGGPTIVVIEVPCALSLPKTSTS